MNFAGCKRKFDVEAYITRVGNETLRVKNAAAKASAAKAGGAAPAAAAPAAGARAAAGAADKA